MYIIGYADILTMHGNLSKETAIHGRHSPFTTVLHKNQHHIHRQMTSLKMVSLGDGIVRPEVFRKQILIQVIETYHQPIFLDTCVESRYAKEDQIRLSLLHASFCCLEDLLSNFSSYSNQRNGNLNYPHQNYPHQKWWFNKALLRDKAGS